MPLAHESLQELAGNRVRISGFEEWTLGADGLIAESQGRFDQAEYEHQLAHGAEP